MGPLPLGARPPVEGRCCCWARAHADCGHRRLPPPPPDARSCKRSRSFVLILRIEQQPGWQAPQRGAGTWGAAVRRGQLQRSCSHLLARQPAACVAGVGLAAGDQPGRGGRRLHPGAWPCRPRPGAPRGWLTSACRGGCMCSAGRQTPGHQCLSCCRCSGTSLLRHTCAPHQAPAGWVGGWEPQRWSRTAAGLPSAGDVEAAAGECWAADHALDVGNVGVEVLQLPLKLVDDACVPAAEGGGGPMQCMGSMQGSGPVLQPAAGAYPHHHRPW